MARTDHLRESTRKFGRRLGHPFILAVRPAGTGLGGAPLVGPLVGQVLALPRGQTGASFAFRSAIRSLGASSCRPVVNRFAKVNGPSSQEEALGGREGRVRSVGPDPHSVCRTRQQ